MSESYHDQDDVIGFCPDMRHPWGCQDDSGHTPSGLDEPVEWLTRLRTARELLIGKVRDAIFDELDAQHEPGDIGGAGYWDREFGCLDGEPDWGAVADAAIRAIQSEEKP